MGRLVQGRGITAGVLSTSADRCGVTVRLDDNDHPEFWAAAYITFEHLKVIIGEVLMLREQPDLGQPLELHPDHVEHLNAPLDMAREHKRGT